MAHPFKSQNKQPLTFEQLLNEFRQLIHQFPDKRTGKNTRYRIEDAALGAFSVFFTQSPSFLAHQTAMTEAKGKSNAQTLFGLQAIPTDNHIRDLLDIVSPQLIFPMFNKVFSVLNELGHLQGFRAVNEQLLIVLDGSCNLLSPESTLLIALLCLFFRKWILLASFFNGMFKKMIYDGHWRKN